MLNANNYIQYTHHSNAFWNFGISRKCKSLEFLTNFKHKLDYKELCCNEYAIPLLVEYTNKNYLNWDTLSLNKNAISILKDNIDRINWDNLSLNINAIELLKEWKEDQPHLSYPNDKQAKACLALCGNYIRRESK